MIEQNNGSYFKRLEPKLVRWIVNSIAKYYLRKPDLSELMQIKFTTFKSLFDAGMNELFYRLGLTYGYKLTAVNLEVTNYCNIKCKMCPVGGSMKREKGFMDLELFKKIIEENPQLEFILPYQWGEPLMHENIFYMIEYAAKRNIRTMLTSNATLLNEQTCNKIIDSGLTRITFSVDGIGQTYTNIRGVEYSKIKENILLLRKIRDERRSCLKIDVSMVVFQETEPEVEKFFEEWSPIADRVQAIPVFASQQRLTPCRELWRGVLVVLWDGRVTICCADYDGIMACGDANKDRLADIWNGVQMEKIREKHLRRKFSGLCKMCGEYESAKVSKRFN